MATLHTAPRRTRIALFFGLCWLYMSLHLDRQLLAVLAESLRSDLALTDRQLGALTGSAFSIVYALLGLYFGALADRSDRLRWIRTGACIWSGSSILGGLASHYVELIAARAGVAVGEAVATAAAISLMAEVAGTRHRARAASVFFACAFAGAGAAAALGGGIAGLTTASSPLPAWRLTMIAAGVPGLLGALYLGFFQWDSRQHPIARASHDPKIFVLLWVAACLAILAQISWAPSLGVPIAWVIAVVSASLWIRHLTRGEHSAYRATFGNTSFRWLLLAFSAAFFVDAAAEFWLFPYAQRQFDLGAAEIGTQLGGLLLVGGMVGCLGGGWLADLVRARRTGFAAWIALAGVVVEAIALLFAVGSKSYNGLLISFAVVSIASGAWVAVAATMGLDIVPANHRGTGAAVYFLAITLFGPSLGPFLVGYASDRLGSLTKPLEASTLVMIVSALALIQLARRATRTRADGPHPADL